MLWAIWCMHDLNVNMWKVFNLSGRQGHSFFNAYRDVLVFGYNNKAPFSVSQYLHASARGSIPLTLCWIEVLWVSGAAGDWEEELNQASFVDQLSLAELCHSKLGPLHPEPGEVLTCKWRTECSKAPRLLTKMLQGQKKKKRGFPDMYHWRDRGRPMKRAS